MKTFHKPLLIILGLSFLLCACSTKDELLESGKPENIEYISTRATSVEPGTYYYHSGTDLVLQSYDLFSDPFIHRIDEHYNGTTHLGVKFFPGSFEQQRYLNNMDSLMISYIPFGYSPVSPKQQEGLCKETLPRFSEINPYTVDTKDYKSTEPDYNPMDGRLIRLPILYAIWPKEEPLPEDIDYEICFEASLPEVQETNATRF